MSPRPASFYTPRRNSRRNSNFGARGKFRPGAVARHSQPARIHTESPPRPTFFHIFWIEPKPFFFTFFELSRSTQMRGKNLMRFWTPYLHFVLRLNPNLWKKNGWADSTRVIEKIIDLSRFNSNFLENFMGICSNRLWKNHRVKTTQADVYICKRIYESS
jgi:hypothetical protein